MMLLFVCLKLASNRNFMARWMNPHATADQRGLVQLLRSIISHQTPDIVSLTTIRWTLMSSNRLQYSSRPRRFYRMHETDVSLAWCQSVILSVTRACAMQKRLNGSRFCSARRLLGPREHCIIQMGPIPAWIRCGFCHITLVSFLMLDRSVNQTYFHPRCLQSIYLQLYRDISTWLVAINSLVLSRCALAPRQRYPYRFAGDEVIESSLHGSAPRTSATTIVNVACWLFFDCVCTLNDLLISTEHTRRL